MGLGLYKYDVSICVAEDDDDDAMQTVYNKLTRARSALVDRTIYTPDVLH